jgi:hypothetical protein
MGKKEVKITNALQKKTPHKKRKKTVETPGYT